MYCEPPVVLEVYRGPALKKVTRKKYFFHLKKTVFFSWKIFYFLFFLILVFNLFIGNFEYISNFALSISGRLSPRAGMRVAGFCGLGK